MMLIIRNLKLISVQSWTYLAEINGQFRAVKTASFSTYRMGMPNNRLLFFQGAVPLRRTCRCCNFWFLFVPFRPDKSRL